MQICGWQYYKETVAVLKILAYGWALKMTNTLAF